jgi:peroxiredoxin
MRTILLFLFLIWAPLLQGQQRAPVVLQGDSAAAWAGMRFPVLLRGDMITHLQDTVGYLEVKEDGTFLAELPLSCTAEVDIYPGKYKLYLYAIPGTTYHLQLPPRKDKEIADILNPYFRPEMHPWLPVDAGPGELNILILRFEEMYNPYFYRHATYVAMDRSDTTLPAFVQAVRDTFAGVKDPFFTAWMEARLAMLETMKLPAREQVLEKYRGFADSVLLYNPAYMELFNQVFSNYFNYLTRHRHVETLRSVVKHGDGDSLRLLIRNDLQVDARDFVDLVALRGIYDAWYNKTFTEEELLTLLHSFSAGIVSPEIRHIARNIQIRFNTLRPGTAAPSFLLKGLDGRRYRPEDFRGKYLYLNFSSRLSYSSLRQFPVLEELLGRYGDHLAVVTVAIEDKPEMLRAFVNDKGYTWPFLICDGGCDVARKYNVRGFPTYYLIDPQGKVLLAPAPAPTENFEEIFKGILEKAGLRKAEDPLPGEHQ